jgi:hypothetical protein
MVPLLQLQVRFNRVTPLEHCAHGGCSGGILGRNHAVGPQEVAQRRTTGARRVVSNAQLGE